MTLKNDIELANTRAKLQLLEDRYQRSQDDANEAAHVRELSMRSIKSTINQFKEEIAHYEAHRLANSQRELEVSHEKLRLLEKLRAEAIADTDGDSEVREAELESLQRQINQLKENISRYEARQPIRR